MHTVLITGAASGLGWELARVYHAQGYNLLLTDINAQALEQRVKSLGSERVSGLAGDITSSLLQQQLLQHCRQRFGRLDVLINNAGITHRSPTCQTKPAVFRRVMEVDYHAPVELTLGALTLLKQHGGQIICIGSMAGWMPLLGRAGYCAAKSALSQFFEVLRAEVARDGIHTLMVYPSFLDTPIDQHALAGDGKPAKHPRSTLGAVRSAQWIAKEIFHAQQIGRERLFADHGSWWASLLWRIAPRLYYRKMSRRFAAEMGQ